MAEDTWKPLEEGEIIWQSRLPGGLCLFLEEHEVQEGDRLETYYTVLHPSEGLIKDPSYYYMTLEEEEKHNQRQLIYELKKRGMKIPDWLFAMTNGGV